MFSTTIRSIFVGVQNHLNTTYIPHQDWSDVCKHGSRNIFSTDMSINGEYFRSKSKNEYYQIIDKNTQAKDISKLTFFIPSEKIKERLILWDYDHKKHLIVRLDFNKDKGYFVESYQDITITDPDVIIMTVDDKELLANLPIFTPLPRTNDGL
jgi:hypothetical protein